MVRYTVAGYVAELPEAVALSRVVAMVPVMPPAPRPMGSHASPAVQPGNSENVTLIVMATGYANSGDPATRLRVKALIAQLDTPVENGSATQVRYLLFSDATDLATRLKEITE